VKRLITIFVIALLFSGGGCSLDHQNNPSDENSDKISPLVIFEPNQNESKGLVIGGVKDGRVLAVESFLHNGKHIKEIESVEEIVESELIMKGDVIKIYNQDHQIGMAVCKSVEYSTLNIESQNLFWVIVSDLDDEYRPFIGISCEWDPLPRTPKIEENRIEVDIDGNGMSDTLSWKNELLSTEDDDEKSEVYQLAIAIDLNGERHMMYKKYSNMVHLSYLTAQICILDVTGNGKMNIIVYTSDIGSSVSVYDIDENGFVELLDFLIYSGP